jgi:hypothetical protein
VIVLLLVIYGLQIFAYSFYYFSYYPKISASAWQYGYAPMIPALEALQIAHPDLPVYLDRSAGRPLMYYFWYRKLHPRLVQARENLETQDQAEFVTFEKVSSLALSPAPEQIIAFPAEHASWYLDENHYQLSELTIISDPANQPSWYVGVLRRLP